MLLNNTPQEAMNRAKSTILTVVVLLALAAALGQILFVRQLPDKSPPPGPGRANALALTPSADVARGRQLAQTYCQTCHLLPDPALLDKISWEKGALPYMAPWLGMAPPDLESPREPPIHSGTNLFPIAPILLPADWRLIGDYYRSAAPEAPIPQIPHAAVQAGLPQFTVKTLAYQRPVPMTSLVKIDAANHRLFVGDAMTRTLEALDSAGQRQFAVEFDSGPISLTLKAGAMDLTLIGRFSPSDETKGKLLRLQPAPDDMKIGKLLGSLRRPTDTAFADLNGDGREDFIVCQFGHHLGRLSWFENLGDDVKEHVLADRPGAIRSQVYDVNHDGRPDIFALFGQAREGLSLFLNQGHNEFTETILIQQHPAFGYTYFELVDFNQDGHIDILTTNGDNGEYISPPKNYHGVRVYLNDGHNRFEEKFFFPLNGAYKAVALDFDQDGDLDIAAVSFFPDYRKSPDESFVYLENQGGLVFKAYSFPESTAGRWVTMDAGDLDGDGDADIVLGSLIIAPTTIPIPSSISEAWKTNRLAVLLLDNKLR